MLNWQSALSASATLQLIAHGSHVPMCHHGLQVEAMRQRTGQANSLTSLDGPAIDWVALAAGMGVPGGRADSCEQLIELIKQGLQQRGPFLVHAALAG